MTHATQIPCSYGTQDIDTVPRTASDRQAATRAAYIARVVSEAPPLSTEQVDLLAVMLAPAIRQNATPAVSVAEYQHWEIRRHLDAETPGRHGYFEDAA